MLRESPTTKLGLSPLPEPVIYQTVSVEAFPMANEGSSNTAMVIIFLIVILAVGGFFVYRGGYFSQEKKVDINVKLPNVSVEK